MRNNVCLTILSILLLFTTTAEASNCGKYLGKTITTYGGMSCTHAKNIYKAFNKGHIAKGWTCGQSVGGCGKGNIGFYFK